MSAREPGGRVAAALLTTYLWALAPTVACAEGPTVWEMRGSGATVWLLGSVHLLRESDYPLPESVDRVMARAERLVLELDLDAVDPITSQMIVFSLGRLEEGQTLADVMGKRSYRLAAKRAEKLGIDLGMLSALKPWFAALTIMNIEMLRLGFNPELGLEQYLANQARQSGKEIVGLETMEYQLGLFDELSYDTQSALLLQTLSEAEDLQGEMSSLVSAWRQGETQALAAALTRSFSDYPEVYRSIVTDRNEAWVSKILDLGSRGDDSLVVVGALHLVGDDSVIEMLRSKGAKLRRLE